MLFKVRGLVEEDGNWFWDANHQQERLGKIEYKKTFYIESPSIQKALTKGKKIFKHIHSVTQVEGEVYKEGEE
jgi:hypothetical protein